MTLFTLSFFNISSHAQSKSNQQLAMNAKLPVSIIKPAHIDYNGFYELVEEVKPYREKRTIDFDKFLEMAQKEGVILLDTRSESAYKGKHLKGAIHLNFSDFTEEKLAKVIPSKDTPILIYCNNNFLGDPMSFALKSRPLALNIPTFINLYGYGYKNVYELGALIPIDHNQLEFEGDLVK